MALCNHFPQQKGVSQMDDRNRLGNRGLDCR